MPEVLERPRTDGNLAFQQRVLPHKLPPTAVRQLLDLEAELERRCYNARIQHLSQGSPFMRYVLTYFQHKMQWQDGPQQGQFIAPAPVHYQIAREFDEGLHSWKIGGWQSLTEIFRGGAKSTYVTVAGSIYAIINGKRNVLIICATQQEVKERIQDITHEIVTNGRLLRDHPDLKRAKDDKGQFISYTDKMVVFANGARIRGFAFQDSLRGSNWNGARPDCVICDDVETDKMQRSDTLMHNAWHWLEHTLLGALSKYAAFFWVGTPLSPHCILYRLREEKEWTGPRQPLLNEDGTPHWAAFCTPEWIAAMEKLLGPHAMDQELHLISNPTALEAFHRDWLDRNQYNPELLHVDNGKVEYNGQALTVYGWYDAAASLEPTADRTAIVIVGIDRNQDVYVLDVWVGRESTPKVAEALIRLNAYWRPRKIGMQKKIGEIMMQQQILSKAAVPIEGISQPKDESGKEFRIRGLSVYVQNGKVKFNFQDHTQRTELRKEFLNYPSGHDDIPDACEGAVMLAITAGSGLSPDNLSNDDPVRECFDAVVGF